MSVAHDLNLLEEQKRMESARKLVTEALNRLHLFCLQADAIHAGEPGVYQDLRFMAQELVRSGQSLRLGLLVACAKEVLHFAELRFESDSFCEETALHMESALDTLGMELSRLQHDRELH